MTQIIGHPIFVVLLKLVYILLEASEKRTFSISVAAAAHKQETVACYLNSNSNSNALSLNA
jgi:hypothetical protein